jgi:hypothetical protein
MELKDKTNESETLLKYIYTLPRTTTIDEIIKICKMALKKLDALYIDIISNITDIYNCTSVLRIDITDARKKINIYIEKIQY